jgi:predicted metal-dependent phosphoesterase TrpH
MTAAFKIDLHMHSSVSDGTDTPRELLEKVRKSGMEVFSLTDHDAVKGYGMIRKALREGDPRFLYGAEFSCRDQEGKYHILGYGYDPDSPAIRSVIQLGHSYFFLRKWIRISAPSAPTPSKIPKIVSGVPSPV